MSKGELIYKRKLLLSMLLLLLIFLSVFFVRLESLYGNEDEEKIDGTCQIAINDDRIYIDDTSMAIIDGNRVIIGKSGNYRITGQSDDAAIIVDTNDKDNINIVLENLALKCRDFSPFYIKKGGDINILLVGYNAFEDADAYEGLEDGKPDACIYSKSDMTFMGDGHLDIKGHYRNGISVKGDLSINAGQYNITSNGDAIKVRSKKDSTKGKFFMDGGIMFIESMDEGIQADSELKVVGGEVQISSVGDYIKCDENVSVEPDCVFTK